MSSDYDFLADGTGRAQRIVSPAARRAEGDWNGEGEMPSLVAALLAIEENLLLASHWDGDWAQRMTAAEEAADAIEALPQDCSEILGYWNPFAIAAEVRLAIIEERRHNDPNREPEPCGPGLG